MEKEKIVYLFTSNRLGFRNWRNSDLALMLTINADKKVMEFFPGIPTEKATLGFIEKMQKQFQQKGYCYFAVDTLADRKCIGFIGISEQTYEADFTPCVDIGWRIQSSSWGKGYATEGAKRCLEYAFQELKLDTIYSIAPVVNKKSIHIMEKIGMKKVKTFEHPLLLHDERLKECVLYEVRRF